MALIAEVTVWFENLHWFLRRDIKPVILHSMKLDSVIHSDPEILGGTLVFVGTRVPVQSLFDHLEAGDSIDEFLDGFPSVRREQVIALLEASRQQILQTA
jgi:uncharacterized protein (DUF433 family)